jgi:Flp pilus assembly protein CpaB
MKKLTCVLAILVAASTAAVAKDLKQDKKSAAPTVAATQMNDAEMDNVTAAGHPTGLGRVLINAEMSGFGG